MTMARSDRMTFRASGCVEPTMVELDVDARYRTLDLASVETTIKYEGYLRQQEGEVQRARKDEEKRVPRGFPFARVPGLSREVVQRLIQVQPDTLGHALRIPGVTPAAVAVLSAYLHRLPPASL